MDHRKEAKEILSWVQAACGDYAHDIVNFGVGDVTDYDNIAKAKKNGIRDIVGWYADELYNDEDFLTQFVGDKTMDIAKGDKECFVNILNEIEKNAHSSMKRAVTHLKKGVKQ